MKRLLWFIAIAYTCLLNLHACRFNPEEILLEGLVARVEGEPVLPAGKITTALQRIEELRKDIDRLENRLREDLANPTKRSRKASKHEFFVKQLEKARSFSETKTTYYRVVRTVDTTLFCGAEKCNEDDFFDVWLGEACYVGKVEEARDLLQAFADMDTDEEWIEDVEVSGDNVTYVAADGPNEERNQISVGVCRTTPNPDLCPEARQKCALRCNHTGARRLDCWDSCMDQDLVRDCDYP